MRPYGTFKTDHSRSLPKRGDSKHKRLPSADKMFFVGVES